MALKVKENCQENKRLHNMSTFKRVSSQYYGRSKKGVINLEMREREREGREAKERECRKENGKRKRKVFP